MKRSMLLAAGILIAVSCQNTSAQMDEEAERKATAFATAYFNYDFQAALETVTPESEKWLRFAASNVTQEVVNALNARNAAAIVEIADMYKTDDSTMTVNVVVSNFLLQDSIGQAGHTVEEGLFRLIVVKRDGKSYVKMEGLPRSEKQNRD